MITSAGRRVGLVRLAQAAAASRGGIVICTDMNVSWSAACQVADVAVSVPPLSDPGYLPELRRIVSAQDVGLIIPTLDPELALMASVRDQWAEIGVAVSVPDSSIVRDCRDKRRVGAVFGQFGIPTPASIEDDFTFPRFVKPVAGSMSHDTHVVLERGELDRRWGNPSAYLHQELVDGSDYSEFTVDLYYRRNGEVSGIVPRRRLEVRAGEVSKGVTQKAPLTQFLYDRMASFPGMRGAVAAQFFVANDWAGTDRPVIGIEINPRFGGGYPLTDAAGGRFVEWLVSEYLDGVPPEYTEDWTDGLVMLRYDAEVLIARDREAPT